MYDIYSMKIKFKFSYLMLIIALSVAGCAGYFSVWGLSQLFAGASTAVIIMASILEIGKVVTTTALHTYWDKLAKGLKIYLTGSVLILMIITSVGIYGFLSNAYQQTANKLEIHEGELNVLDSKKVLFEKNITDNEKIVTTKNKRIDQLTNLRNNQENRLDSAKTTKGKDKVRADIALATIEIQKLSTEIDGLNSKNTILSDSVSRYSVKSLELNSNSEVAGEVGPLKYIAELTGQPMGKVVNYLILLLIFVFDPLAIALILMTNRVIQLESDSSQLVKEPIEGPIEGVTEGVTEGVNEDVTEDEHDGVPCIVSEPDIELEENIEQPVIEPIPTIEVKPPIYKKEPVITTGKINLEDIKEIKENQNRGFTVPIPNPKKTNTIERIGANKEIKDGDSNKLFFKRSK